MDKIRDAVSQLLNPGQVPGVTADQPIYATVKQWPEDCGESHFLIMFRGLHLEMTALPFDGTFWCMHQLQAQIKSQHTLQMS